MILTLAMTRLVTSVIMPSQYHWPPGCFTPIDSRAPGPPHNVIGRAGRASHRERLYEPLCAPLVADELGLGVGVGVPAFGVAGEDVPSAACAASARVRASCRRV